MRPDYGLYVVALWTALTSLILLLRLIQVAFAFARAKQRQESWLTESNASDRYSFTYKTFSSTRGAYGAPTNPAAP